MHDWPLLKTLSNQKEISDTIENFNKIYKLPNNGPAMLAAMSLAGNAMNPDDGMTAYEVLNWEALAICLTKAMLTLDESRFTLYDYMDGVINATKTVDLEKLLSLNVEEFCAAVIWLAIDKRETYEDREHCQEPLEIDIFKD